MIVLLQNSDDQFLNCIDVNTFRRYLPGTLLYILLHGSDKISIYFNLKKNPKNSFYTVLRHFVYIKHIIWKKM